MNRYYTTTPRADQDLEELFYWYASEGGVDLAMQFEAALLITLGDLTDEPTIGAIRKYPPPLQELHKWNVQKPFNKTLIFYRITDYGIDVIRVLRGERDIETLLSLQN